MPKHEHCCDHCKFITTLDDCDVYVCGDGNDQSMIIRYSDEPSDNNSMRIDFYKRLIVNNGNIGGNGPKGSFSLPYQEYLLSEFVAKEDRIRLIALAMM